MPEEIFSNRILRRLDRRCIDRLELEPINLPAGFQVEAPGEPINSLIFIEQGVASITSTLANGLRVDVAVAGQESILGVSSLTGMRCGVNQSYMQVGGHGFRTRTALAVREFKRGEIFQEATLRYIQIQSIQFARTASCNAHHTVEQRLIKGLLLCANRNGNRVLPLKHQFLAEMIGASRSTVTIIAGQLQARKLIQSTRGQLHLLDLHGLEKAACECYQVVRDHFAAFAELDAVGANQGCS